LWLSLGIAMLLFGVGCRRVPPAVDLSARPAPSATVTGVVRVTEASRSVSGRTVEIVNTSTGERRSVQTTDNGGFALAVPAGRYRVDVTLRDGETIVKRPGILDMQGGAVGSPIEFVVGPSRVVHPRGPAYRVDNGLGSPIA
jgi:hypothetical protein